MSIIENALLQTNIQQLKDKKCFELSDGQLQKVIKLLYEGRPRAKDFDSGVKPNEIDEAEILIE